MIRYKLYIEQHPRAGRNTQHVHYKQQARAGQNTQPLTKSEKLIINTYYVSVTYPIEYLQIPVNSSYNIKD